MNKRIWDFIVFLPIILIIIFIFLPHILSEFFINKINSIGEASFIIYIPITFSFLLIQVYSMIKISQIKNFHPLIKFILITINWFTYFSIIYMQFTIFKKED